MCYVIIVIPKDISQDVAQRSNVPIAKNLATDLKIAMFLPVSLETYNRVCRNAVVADKVDILIATALNAAVKPVEN